MTTILPPHPMPHAPPPIGRRLTITGRFGSWLAIGILCFRSQIALADTMDELITKRMREHHIAGLSLAIIQDGKIVKATGYGFTDKTCQTPVDWEFSWMAASEPFDFRMADAMPASIRF